MTGATTTVENVERFLGVLSTKNAEKRAEHGSRGSTVFREAALLRGSYEA